MTNEYLNEVLANLEAECTKPLPLNASREICERRGWYLKLLDLMRKGLAPAPAVDRDTLGRAAVSGYRLSYGETVDDWVTRPASDQERWKMAADAVIAVLARACAARLESAFAPAQVKTEQEKP